MLIVSVIGVCAGCMRNATSSDQDTDSDKHYQRDTVNSDSTYDREQKPDTALHKNRNINIDTVRR